MKYTKLPLDYPEIISLIEGAWTYYRRRK